MRISLRNQILSGAALALAMCLTTRAQTTIIAQDNFNYGNGSLSGQNGGTGWNSSWVNDYTSGDTLNTSSTGLTYTGLTAGGSAVWNGASGNGISEDSRYLPFQDSGQVYIQFLCQFGSSSGGGTPNLRFTDSLTNLCFGLGGNGGVYGSHISILDSTLTAASNGSSTATNSLLSNVNLVLARVDYSDDTISLWVDPNLASFNYITPSTPDASLFDTNLDFNNITIVTRSPGTISDLQIFTVPEPTTLSLFGTGALLASLWRLRTRK